VITGLQDPLVKVRSRFVSTPTLDRSLPACPPKAGSELTLFDEHDMPVGVQPVPAGFMPYPGLRLIFGDATWEVRAGGVQVVFPDHGPYAMLIEVRVQPARNIHDVADFPEDRRP